MARSMIAAAVVVCLFLSAQADAQWVKFADQTSTRLSAASSLAATNVDEKSYAWGDLDQDGDIDLVVFMKQPFTSRGTRRNLLLMNENGVLTDRTNQYATASDYPGSQGFLDLTNDRDVQVIDLNGDGWLDVVTCTTLSGNTDGTIGQKYISHPRIYLNLGNDGGGNWLGLRFEFYVNGDTNNHRVPTMPAEPRFCAVAFGDIDNDGDLDLYFGDYQQGGARPVDLNDRLWINNGSAKFTDESSARMTAEMLESSFSMSTFIADANNDGVLDIFKDDALNAPQGISVSYNNPNNPGFFNFYQVAYGNAPYEVFVGDLNNDGRLDFIVSDDGQDRYVLNQGNNAQGYAIWTNFSFTYQVGGDDGFAGDQIIADLNNDGWKDAIITDVDVDISGCARRTHIFRNYGNAPNVTMREDQVGGKVCDIATAMLVGAHDAAVFDINGDGWLDMVLGRCTGTQVYINVPPTGIQFTYPSGQPGFVLPNTPTNFPVQLNPIGVGTIQPGSGMIHISVNGGSFTSSSMAGGGGNLYTATLPAGNCADRYEFYFSGQIQGGNTFTDPPGAPASVYSTVVAAGEEIMLRETFEAGSAGWTVTNHASLTGGAWQTADPNSTIFSGAVAAPEDDAGAPLEQTTCFVTENGPPGGAAGANDVDGGPTILTSPIIDLAGSDATISYARWFFSSSGAPRLTVEVSNNDGGTWTTVEQVGHTQTVPPTSGAWLVNSFLVSDLVTPTAQVRVRFSVADSAGAVTEAGIDNFQVTQLICEVACACSSDMDADTQRTGKDVQLFVECMLGGGSNCACADVNGGGLDVSDINAFVAEILSGPACP